jgi:hypothetical protein
MPNNSVRQIKEEFDLILNFLVENKQPSLQSSLDRHYRKVLLLSAASYFEHEITEILLSFFENKSGDERIVKFYKIIDRKYFQLFIWDNYAKNKGYGDFIGIFEIDTNGNIQDSIKAFLEIGHFRNQLVHNNFAEYTEEKTTEEIYDLFKRAEKFIEHLKIFFGVKSTATSI